MLGFIFLPLFLCCQYVASVPVASPVFSHEAGAGLRPHLLPTTWLQAALHCQLEGGVLASPTTSTIAKEMQAAMAEHSKLSLGVFIGVTDMLSKGDFKSLDGAAVADIPLEWAAGEPNNAANAEDCLALTGAGALADVSCSAVLPYFCRKESAHNVTAPNLPKEDCARPKVPPCNGKSGYEYEPRTGSCYKFHGTAQAWLPALKTCHAEGGYLAVINNQTEATVLKEIHNKNKKDIAGSINTKVITIGLKKWADNEWVTIHGESLSEAGFSEWSGGEPNNSGGTENCGAIFDTGLLNDVTCEHKFAFICEITS